MQRVMFDAVWGIVWDSLARLPLADREDLTQEIIVRVWQKRDLYRSEKGSIEVWVRTIAKRMAINFARKGRVPDELPETMHADARTPEETVMWSQLAELADHVLAGLPEEERRVLILHEIEGKSFDEIAKLLKISKGTAHARFARGMAKLRKAKDEGKLNTIVVPFVPENDPPTPEMRERAWQRFVDSGALDLPPDSEPPPSGTRRTGPLARLRKLGPLVAIFLGPGLAEPHGDPPATTSMVTVVAPTTSIATEPIATVTAVTVPKPATTTTPPRRARPLGQVQPEHGGADARDRLKIEASFLEGTASR